MKRVLSSLCMLAFAGCAVEQEPSPEGGSDNAVGEVEESDEAFGEVEQASTETCRQGALFDQTICFSHYYWQTNGRKTCQAGYNAAAADCARGYVRVHRLIQGKYHRESSNYEDGSRLEATFYFAASPQPGANSSPIRRCFIGNNSAKGDFPSRSSNCEGQGSPTGYHAYSYPSNVGARPVYRCRVGTDHFLSRASNCEGQVNEGLLGYAF